MGKIFSIFCKYISENLQCKGYKYDITALKERLNYNW